VVGEATPVERGLNPDARRRRVERWLVVAIAPHGYAVGFGLLFLTE